MLQRKWEVNQWYGGQWDALWGTYRTRWFANRRCEKLRESHRDELYTGFTVDTLCTHTQHNTFHRPYREGV
jgi:hypothetical protein